MSSWPSSPTGSLAPNAAAEPVVFRLRGTRVDGFVLKRAGRRLRVQHEAGACWIDAGDVVVVPDGGGDTVAIAAPSQGSRSLVSSSAPSSPTRPAATISRPQPPQTPPPHAPLPARFRLLCAVQAWYDGAENVANEHRLTTQLAQRCDRYLATLGWRRLLASLEARDSRLERSLEAERQLRRGAHYWRRSELGHALRTLWGRRQDRAEARRQLCRASRRGARVDLGRSLRRWWARADVRTPRRVLAARAQLAQAATLRRWRALRRAWCAHAHRRRRNLWGTFQMWKRERLSALLMAVAAAFARRYLPPVPRGAAPTALTAPIAPAAPAAPAASVATAAVVTARTAPGTSTAPAASSPASAASAASASAATASAATESSMAASVTRPPLASPPAPPIVYVRRAPPSLPYSAWAAEVTRLAVRWAPSSHGLPPYGRVTCAHRPSANGVAGAPEATAQAAAQATAQAAAAAQATVQATATALVQATAVRALALIAATRLVGVRSKVARGGGGTCGRGVDGGGGGGGGGGTFVPTSRVWSAAAYVEEGPAVSRCLARWRACAAQACGRVVVGRACWQAAAALASIRRWRHATRTAMQQHVASYVGYRRQCLGGMRTWRRRVRLSHAQLPTTPHAERRAWVHSWRRWRTAAADREADYQRRGCAYSYWQTRALTRALRWLHAYAQVALHRQLVKLLEAQERGCFDVRRLPPPARRVLARLDSTNAQ